MKGPGVRECMAELHHVCTTACVHACWAEKGMGAAAEKSKERQEKPEEGAEVINRE